MAASETVFSSRISCWLLPFLALIQPPPMQAVAFQHGFPVQARFASGQEYADQRDGSRHSDQRDDGVDGWQMMMDPVQGCPHKSDSFKFF